MLPRYSGAWSVKRHQGSTPYPFSSFVFHGQTPMKTQNGAKGEQTNSNNNNNNNTNTNAQRSVGNGYQDRLGEGVECVDCAAGAVPCGDDGRLGAIGDGEHAVSLRTQVCNHKQSIRLGPDITSNDRFCLFTYVACMGRGRSLWRARGSVATINLSENMQTSHATARLLVGLTASSVPV